MNNLISNFSSITLTDYLKRNAGLKPEKEDLDYIIQDKNFSDFSELTRIGNISFKNSDELIVFTCKFKGVLSERSSKKKQFEIAKLVLKEDFKDGAIFVFYDDEGKFRFSFIRRNWGGKGENKYTTWKRFTFFVDPRQHNKTFRQRIGNCTFKDLDSIQDAFSVEKLTKEFYNDLFKWYQWTLTPEVGITYPNDVTTADDDRVKLEEQIIRLITRLLFVWFIKQKNLVPSNLFNVDGLKSILKEFDPHSKDNGNYYNAILQNLFFATLNKPVTEREFAKLVDKRDIKTRYRYADMFAISEQKVLDLFRPIPFLNGGLFECLDKELSTDGVKYHLDGFSRNAEKSPNGNYKHRAFIPNCIFFGDETNEGLIPLLERYNFTVEENVPNEVQVALDPELLGNVFENLLGAFNPETQESARKQSGSFYTPKEIVAYMVDESLIAYLDNALPDIEEATIRALFEQDELPAFFAQNHAFCEEIASQLRKVKILDPACGSGAFPMGILNRMVEILDKLDVKDSASHHDLKLHLIEECIYGVDIQTIATQISKLRFFISLIVEQEVLDLSKPEENYGVLTLPNLETKFVAANTLIAVKTKPAQLTIFDKEEIEQTKKELLEIRKEHFYAKSAYKKKELREKDAQLREKLAQLLKESGEFAPEDAIQFSQWNPYDQNASSPFFDPEWMFGEEKGFDVVIGNPPYVQLQKERGKLAKMYQYCGYKTFAKTGDIYSLFYERGWQLLKDKGTLCYITSNKWMRAGYGESTRKFFVENTNPILLIDFAGQKIFESATVDTNILLFVKDKNRQQTKACIVKEKVLNNLSDYFRQNSTVCNFSNNESWVILSEIEQRIKAKIEAVGVPLKDWDINIYRGILTGYNEAFIIDGKKKDELISEDPKSAEIIRPLLRGRDIKRYSYEFADKYLIATFPSKNYNIDDFPAVKQFLNGFYPKLKQTGENLTKQEVEAVLNHAKSHGISINESSLQKSRKRTANKWFETQDTIAYWEDFYRQKIMYSEIVREPQFYLDKKGEFYPEATTFIMSGENLEYLYNVLHTRAVTYFFKTFYAGGGLGNEGFRYKKAFLEKLPIPLNIENVEINKDNANDVIFKLYKLDTSEIEFLENQL